MSGFKLSSFAEFSHSSTLHSSTMGGGNETSTQAALRECEADSSLVCLNKFFLYAILAVAALGVLLNGVTSLLYLRLLATHKRSQKGSQKEEAKKSLKTARPPTNKKATALPDISRPSASAGPRKPRRKKRRAPSPPPPPRRRQEVVEEPSSPLSDKGSRFKENEMRDERTPVTPPSESMPRPKPSRHKANRKASPAKRRPSSNHGDWDRFKGRKRREQPPALSYTPYEVMPIPSADKRSSRKSTPDVMAVSPPPQREMVRLERSRPTKPRWMKRDGVDDDVYTTF